LEKFFAAANLTSATSSRQKFKATGKIFLNVVSSSKIFE